MFSYSNETKPAVILDFDGTLANDELIVVDIFNEYADSYGIKPVKRVYEIKNKVYWHPISCLRLLCVRNQLKNSILNAIAKNIDLLIIDIEMSKLIKELYEKKIMLGILTTNRESTVRKFLVNNNINENIFTFIESHEDKRKRLKELVKIHKIDRSCAYYIGDQTTDIDAAKNVIGTIAVTWGYDEKHILAGKNPTHMAETPNEIKKILKENKKLNFGKYCFLCR